MQNPIFSTAAGAIALAILACNFPGFAPVPTGSSVTPALPAASQAASTSAQVQPAGEPVLAIAPGTGYLFASAEVVTGPNDRDVWWNGATLVPGKLIVSLGVVEDLSAITQISQSAIVHRELEPVPGEAYVMQTVGGQYVLLRVLAINAQDEITVEWLYPFVGEVLP